MYEGILEQQHPFYLRIIARSPNIPLILSIILDNARRTDHDQTACDSKYRT
jgi:hypothetical protein